MARGLSSTAAGAALALAALWALGWHPPTHAQGAQIFKGADLVLGAELVQQHGCTQCHARQPQGGADGMAIYRPLGRVNTAGLLRGMVEQCNSVLNLQMFPEEVTAVAALLNRDHYRFK
jgi:hypothetical protein